MFCNAPYCGAYLEGQRARHVEGELMRIGFRLGPIPLTVAVATKDRFLGGSINGGSHFGILMWGILLFWVHIRCPDFLKNLPL